MVPRLLLGSPKRILCSESREGSKLVKGSKLLCFSVQFFPSSERSRIGTGVVFIKCKFVLFQFVGRSNIRRKSSSSILKKLIGWDDDGTRKTKLNSLHAGASSKLIVNLVQKLFVQPSVCS